MAAVNLLALVTVICISTTVLVASVSLKEPLKCFFCVGIAPNCTGNKTNLPVMDCETFEVSTPDDDAHQSPSTFHLEFGKTRAILEELKANVKINISIDSKMVCLKSTFEHEDFPEDTHGIVRTCAPEKIMQQDVCHWGNSFISLLNADPGDCSTCNEAYCNAAPDDNVSALFSKESCIFAVSALLLLHTSIA